VIEQNLVGVSRTQRAELLRVGRKRRIGGSEDGDTLGLTEETREVRIQRFSGGPESSQIVYAGDSRGEVLGYCQDAGDDLTGLKMRRVGTIASRKYTSSCKFSYLTVFCEVMFWLEAASTTVRRPSGVSLSTMA
jgi:hypothetical protein